MALYDGFFDASEIIGTHEDGTPQYDREYGPDDFIVYFENLIGSGVCIHDNPDSFLVRLENGAAVVSQGYLFIRGYWLKNDADYTIELPGTATYAIVAHLNLGQRIIDLKADSVAQAYPDSLVLAIVSPTSAEDTRHNTDICGTIDTAGELSSKVEWAINYIDNEIESKLAAAEQTIAAQEARLDAKIAEVQAQVDRITPSPVGSIKFSASQDVGEEWLPCDGSFVNEQDYPELVAALGKLIPSGDKFQLLSSGEIGPQISNGVVYGGRLWVYSYSTQKLYGVDLAGTDDIKEIPITSDNPNFTMCQQPTAAQPIALSILESPVDEKTRIFLAQVLGSNVSVSSGNNISPSMIWLYWAEFSSTATTIEVSAAFNTGGGGAHFRFAYCVPYVISRNENGKEWFYCITSGNSDGARNGLKFDLSGSVSNVLISSYISTNGGQEIRYADAQRIAYDKKNKDESIFVRSITGAAYGSQTYKASTMIDSIQAGIFSRGNTENTPPKGITTTPNALSIAGPNNLIFEISKNAVMQISLVELEAAKATNFGLSLPSAARIFVDGGAYLWGKDIYMIFVGTGIIFSRSLEDGSFGYLDTTSVLGTITQFGYLDYSQDEGTLYLLGQDTTNTVKVAKIVLNTLYDYANDGAWLPMIAADGVPAYIKATENGGDIGPSVPMTINVTNSAATYINVFFNDEILIGGTYTRMVPENGKFSVGIQAVSTGYNYGLKLNGTTILRTSSTADKKTLELNTQDYISSGVTLLVEQGA